MKRANKFLSVFLVLLMIVSIIPMSSITASAASGSDYTSVSALATKLTQIFNGDIDIYSNSACTTEVSMPINTSMNNSTTYYVKSNTTGNTCPGKQCYIYANAVYNKLYNEWVGNGASFAHSVNVITKGKSSLSYSDLVNAGVKCGAYLRTTTNSDGSFNGNKGHSMIILSYNSSNITYLEGNGDGNGAIRITTKTWSNFNSSQLTGKSRYVCHLVQPTESYYNSIYPTVTPPKIVKSSSVVNLTIGSNNSASVDVSYVNGTYPNQCELDFRSNNHAVVAIDVISISTSSYGDATVTLNAQGVGTTSVDIFIVDKATGKTIATDYISVNVSAKTYTVSYNANGGTGAPASQTKTHGTTLTLSSTKPTRTGYTFLGWSTSSTATSATYSAGGSFTSNANTTLYAVWKADSTVLTANSSYSANISYGGKMEYYTFTPSASGKYVIYSTGSDDTKVYLYNSSGTQLDSNDDGGDGNNFRLECDLTAGTTYRFGVKYYNSAIRGTINFSFGQVYNVSYNANGGSGVPSSQKKDYGTTLTLSSTTPTRSGYTFLGWSTSSTATTATYQPGGSFTSNANTTLYAVWQKNSTTPSEPSNPDVDFTVRIQEPSRTTIRYNDGIILHAVVEGELPEGATIEWAVDNNNFEGGYSEDGMDCVIVSKNNGSTIVFLVVCDANDNVIAMDVIEMTSNAGFFQKIGGFFRSLFGTTKIYES